MDYVIAQHSVDKGEIMMGIGLDAAFEGTNMILVPGEWRRHCGECIVDYAGLVRSGRCVGACEQDGLMADIVTSPTEVAWVRGHPREDAG